MVTFIVSPEVFEGTTRIVDKHNEPKLVEGVSSLMHGKYGWSNGLIVELIPYKEQDNRI